MSGTCFFGFFAARAEVGPTVAPTSTAAHIRPAPTTRPRRAVLGPLLEIRCDMCAPSGKVSDAWSTTVCAVLEVDCLEVGCLEVGCLEVDCTEPWLIERDANLSDGWRIDELLATRDEGSRRVHRHAPGASRCVHLHPVGFSAARPADSPGEVGEPSPPFPHLAFRSRSVRPTSAPGRSSPAS